MADRLISYWEYLQGTHDQNIWRSHDIGYRGANALLYDNHIAHVPATGAILHRVERSYELLTPVPGLPKGMERWHCTRVGNQHMTEAQAVVAADLLLARAAHKAARAYLAPQIERIV
jgi:hypothetical protein